MVPNLKKDREAIRNFIMEHTEDADTGHTPETFNEAAHMIWDTFMDEYMSGSSMTYHLRQLKTWQNCFEGWCQGLPSMIDTASYYLHSAVEVLGDLLEETPEERARFSECEAEHMLSYLIYREIRRELDREKARESA